MIIMAKLYVATKNGRDYLIVPNRMATRMTKEWWVVINDCYLRNITTDWVMPDHPIAIPSLPDGTDEETIKRELEKKFGTIVAERSDGKDDVGFIPLNEELWDELQERRGIPDF